MNSLSVRKKIGASAAAIIAISSFGVYEASSANAATKSYTTTPAGLIECAGLNSRSYATGQYANALSRKNGTKDKNGNDLGYKKRPRKTYSKGDSGFCVKRLQDALNHVMSVKLKNGNTAKLTEDGDFGSLTEQAVYQWRTQDAHTYNAPYLNLAPGSGWENNSAKQAEAKTAPPEIFQALAEVRYLQNNNASPVRVADGWDNGWPKTLRK